MLVEVHDPPGWADEMTGELTCPGSPPGGRSAIRARSATSPESGVLAGSLGEGRPRSATVAIAAGQHDAGEERDDPPIHDLPGIRSLPRRALHLAGSIRERVLGPRVVVGVKRLLRRSVRFRHVSEIHANPVPE